MTKLNLQKGQRLDLSKHTSSKNFIAKLYWDANAYDNEAEFDLDALALLLNSDSKLPSGKGFNPNEYIIFYNNLESNCGGVIHCGDEQTGSKEGADEEIILDFGKMDSNVDKVVIMCNIHEAQERKQSFGKIEGSKIEIYDVDNKKVVAEFDLGEDFSTETGVVFGEFYRNKQGNWSFNAVGRGYVEGLGAALQRYGAKL